MNIVVSGNITKQIRITVYLDAVAVQIPGIHRVTSIWQRRKQLVLSMTLNNFAVRVNRAVRTRRSCNCVLDKREVGRYRVVGGHCDSRTGRIDVGYRCRIARPADKLVIRIGQRNQVCIAAVVILIRANARLCYRTARARCDHQSPLD